MNAPCWHAHTQRTPNTDCLCSLLIDRVGVGGVADRPTALPSARARVARQAENAPRAPRAPPRNPHFRKVGCPTCSTRAQPYVLTNNNLMQVRLPHFSSGYVCEVNE